MIDIPEQFLDIPYNASCYPGAKIQKIENGANCQLFVYSILRHFGYSVPDFRSSNLWEDTTYSERVSSLEEFDILFWNKTHDPYGAHLWLYLWNGSVIHLSKEIGKPVIWKLEEFIKKDAYKILIWAKRLLLRE